MQDCTCCFRGTKTGNSVSYRGIRDVSFNLEGSPVHLYRLCIEIKGNVLCLKQHLTISILENLDCPGPIKVSRMVINKQLLHSRTEYITHIMTPMLKALWSN